MWSNSAMPIDTRGFQEQHIGKRLRVELQNGVVQEVELLELTVCAEPEPCCGITYFLKSTNAADEQREIGAVYWTGFAEIKNFRVCGD
jgi:hypothetical protein